LSVRRFLFFEGEKMSTENGIATASQIKEAAQGWQWCEPETVTLPKSGFKLIMRRPTRIFFALRNARRSEEYRQKLEMASAGRTGFALTPYELQLWNFEQDRLTWDAIVAPKPSLTPDANQFDPRWLPDEDIEFIRDYLRGRVLADGNRPEEFRGAESRPAADGGGDGTNIRTAANGDSGAAGSGVAS
jgi:hypothetical protein